MEKNYDSDEMDDKLIVQELMSRSKDYNELASKLTQYFTKKYGPEFGGNVVFSYDLTGNVLTMTCYDQDRVFEIEDEIMDIPTHLKFLRKTAARAKKTGGGIISPNY